jgi:hypothetical protein
MKNWEFVYDRWYSYVHDEDTTERLDLAYLPEKNLVRVEQVTTVLLDEDGVDKLIKRLQSVQREMRKNG